jgi:dihydrolipoamide dehydrogenase
VTLAPGADADPDADPDGVAGVGTTTTLTYSDLVIATGCEPVAPPIEGLADIPAWTTAQSLSSPDLPRRLIVLGGGAAGCELTQVYAWFGSQVTLVEAEPALLPGEPAFAGEILAAALRRTGAEVRLGSRASKAERTSEGLTLALEDGTRIDADRLLLATGRRPRLGGLGLDALGLEVTPGMALPTTTRCEVAGAGGDGVRVWAAGDVTGTTSAHASRYQAGVVAANILGQHGEADYSAIPRCVFTTPSVFAVGAVPGVTAEDAEPAAASTASTASPDHGPGNGARVRRMLRIARVSPERAPAAGPAQDGASPPGAAPEVRLLTARVRLSDTTRGHLGQDDLGGIELYADAGTGVLAGAVAVGPDAASWMGEVTLAIRAKVPVAVLADVVHAFPTYGEALETALRELAGTGGSAAGADQEKGTGTLSELDMETPEGDAIEQHQEVIPDEAVADARREVPFDVNEADAAEQERVVGFDDDDYR